MPDGAAVHSETFLLPDLHEPAEIRVDEWGVPHITAMSAEDVYFAQGFNAGRDRLFQLDIWRRRGLGLLSEALGEQYLEQDRACRLFLYRGSMQTEWSAYGTQAENAVGRFVAGINAFIVLTEECTELLPAEFVNLGFRPLFWQPEDVVRIRSHGRFNNLGQEVIRAMMLRDFGPNAEDLRSICEPRPNLVLPEGLDLSILDDKTLAVYQLALSPVNFGPEHGVLNDPTSELEGSNSWVIGGARTLSGRPIVANDPHRVMSLPSLRYVAHLCCPEFNVIGGGEPVIPGVSIGHNGTTAFGLTIFPIDQEDLYIYELHPDDAELYRYGEGWQRMVRVVEISVTPDGMRHELVLLFTRHGPVIQIDSDKNAAVAVRAAWLEPGMAPYLGSLRGMLADNADAFVAAMNKWGAPGVNQVYADTTGEFGWTTAGLVPVRPNWDGALPVPGDGRYEWAGFQPGALPAVRNPAEGWFATANQMNIDDVPEWEPFLITRDWLPPFRYQRLVEELGRHEHWSIGDSTRLQNDYVSIPAREIVGRLQGVAPIDLPSARALALFAGWEGLMHHDLPQPTLYEAWFFEHLQPDLVAWFLTNQGGDEASAPTIAAAVDRIAPKEGHVGDPRIIVALLDRALSDDHGTTIVLESLSAAFSALLQRWGSDPEAWRWGDAHFAEFLHPLATPANRWNSPPRTGRSGSADTVSLSAYDSSGRQTTGASFRVVIDVGNWDAALFTNTPGQSAAPRSPHFQDLFVPWAADKYLPLLYSAEAIASHTATIIELKPHA